MTILGYHCSHEQFLPSELLQYVQFAERSGFQAAMCSDHFYPWSTKQSQSGFAWSWLGAALQSVHFSLGVVNAPGQRYHPAIIAQACATLAEMYPHRFWVALGTGQVLNEHITGQSWIAKPLRRSRLLECVQILRALWAGETVDHEGLVNVRGARLCTLPAVPPRIVGAAVSVETAEWVGSWADALITVAKPVDELSQVVDAFRRGGGEDKPMLLQAQTSYAATTEEARAAALDQWRNNMLDSSILTEIETPEEFDTRGAELTIDDLKGRIRMSSDIGQHIAWVHEYLALGFEEIYFHNVGRNQIQFIDAFGQHVLPTFSDG